MGIISLELYTKPPGSVKKLPWAQDLSVIVLHCTFTSHLLFSAISRSFSITGSELTWSLVISFDLLDSVNIRRLLAEVKPRMSTKGAVFLKCNNRDAKRWQNPFLLPPEGTNSKPVHFKSPALTPKHTSPLKILKK